MTELPFSVVIDFAQSTELKNLGVTNNYKDLVNLTNYTLIDLYNRFEIKKNITSIELDPDTEYYELPVDDCLKILEIKDKGEASRKHMPRHGHNTPIRLNTNGVFLVNNQKLQVTKEIRGIPNNVLYILYKQKPEFVTTDVAYTEQYVDIPLALVECLIQGMTYHAHSMGVMAIDAQKQGAVIDQYMQRYETAMQKAEIHSHIVPRNIEGDDVRIKGFF